MIAHYSAVKGDSIKAHFQIVQNTADSLWLPLNSFQKAWLLNTLHEISDQTKMVKGIYSVLRTGGEIVILELTPDYEGQLHGGCHKPLMNFEKINEIFTSNGFGLPSKKISSGKKMTFLCFDLLDSELFKTFVQLNSF